MSALVQRVTALLESLEPGPAREHVVQQIESIVAQAEHACRASTAQPQQQDVPRTYASRRRHQSEPADASKHWNHDDDDDDDADFVGAFAYGIRDVAGQKKRPRSSLVVLAAARKCATDAAHAPPSSEDDDELQEMKAFFSRLQSEEKLVVAKDAPPQQPQPAALAKTSWPTKKRRQD